MRFLEQCFLGSLQLSFMSTSTAGWYQVYVDHSRSLQSASFDIYPEADSVRGGIAYQTMAVDAVVFSQSSPLRCWTLIGRVSLYGMAKERLPSRRYLVSRHLTSLLLFPTVTKTLEPTDTGGLRWRTTTRLC